MSSFKKMVKLPHQSSTFNTAKEQPGHKSNDKYQDILIFGYQCKIFRDDVMAKYIDDEKHLIPWMGDEALMVDRYDCRGYLYSQEEFTCNDEISKKQLTPEEQNIERQCDSERYLGLQKDLTEEEFLEEEERKRFRSQYDPTCSYSNIEFQYNEGTVADNSGDEEYDPSACFENEEEEATEKNASPMYKPADHTHYNMKESKGSFATKIQYGNDDLQTGKYTKPDNLDVPKEMDLPDSEKAHSIIEKTALFISKQGIQMEIVLKAKQAGNPQFDFLNYGNWLNPYYKLILQKIRDDAYEPSASDAPSLSTQSKDQNDAGSTKSRSEEDSDSSDDNEYIHPLLQAHLRPIKTTAMPTPSISSTTLTREHVPLSDASAGEPRGTHAPPQGQRNGNPAFPGSSTNAAAVYMARKYENSRKAESSPVDDTAYEREEREEEDNWADQLEEDPNFLARDTVGFPYVVPVDAMANQGSFHPSLAMMSLIPPPPPPGQIEDDHAMDTAASTLHAGHGLPPPPPPPGCSESDVTAVSSQVSLKGHDYNTQQQPQHIVPPPPDLKPVVDKLAEYVSRNGEDFEGEIRKKRDPRFEFLTPESIYFPYYLYKKQQHIIEVAKKKAQDKKEKEGRASKPLRFALKSKIKTRNIVQKAKTVEVFKENEEKENSGNEVEDEFDGYRPNKTKKDKTPMEKAQMAMDEAKRMIAEVQQKQKELQENMPMTSLNATQPQEDANIERERQIQMERRRKAAAFIGKLKQSNSEQDSASSDDSYDSDTSDHEESSDDRDSKPRVKRHFQEKSTENDNPATKLARMDRSSSQD